MSYKIIISIALLIASLSSSSEECDETGLLCRIQKLEQRKLNCRVADATGSNNIASWAKSSKALCHSDEFATGGGCDSTMGIGAIGKFVQNGTRLAQGYQCIVDQASNGHEQDITTAYAVCCKYE